MIVSERLNRVAKLNRLPATWPSSDSGEALRAQGECRCALADRGRDLASTLGDCTDAIEGGR